MELHDLDYKFYHGIRNSGINRDLDLFLLEAVFSNKKIVCRRLNPLYHGVRGTNWAGNGYVCLADKSHAFDYDYNAVLKDIIENLKDPIKLKILRENLEVNVLPCINETDSYFKFIERNISLVINPNGQDIKTVLTNIDQAKLNLDGPIRYTNLTGEYQVKDYIDLDEVVAIGYPIHVLESLNQIKFLLYEMTDYSYYENQVKIEDKIVQIKQLINKYSLQLPIVDLHQKRLIM